MLEELLLKEEGKTLEFKENTQSLQKIVQTIIAFANTAGGTLVVGVKDKTKEVVGLQNALQDEEKIANAVSDSIAPLLIPTFHLYTYENHDVLIITVAQSFAPFYIKSAGIERGTYIRLGSTNRQADAHTILEIQRLRENKNFDAQINKSFSLNNIQFDLAKKLFQEVSKKFTEKTAQSLGLVVPYQNKEFPSNGAVLLFGKDHREAFPDAIIRLGKFLGTTKAEILDHQDLDLPLSIAIDPIIAFIRRHTSMAAKISSIRRKDVPQYPAVVVREAVTNALLHADYSIQGAHITIAIFSDRIEITNPGMLPFGLSLEAAVSGVSQLRNRIIGRVFRELNLIEQWGSGLQRMITTCMQEGIKPPKFEEMGNFFKTTLYHQRTTVRQKKDWHKSIAKYLEKHGEISAKEAQKIWRVTARTTSTRLKSMCEEGLLTERATSPYDPYKTFRA